MAEVLEVTCAGAPRGSDLHRWGPIRTQKFNRDKRGNVRSKSRAKVCQRCGLQWIWIDFGYPRKVD